jgi:hypothetical protein
VVARDVDFHSESVSELRVAMMNYFCPALMTCSTSVCVYPASLSYQASTFHEIAIHHARHAEVGDGREALTDDVGRDELLGCRREDALPARVRCRFLQGGRSLPPQTSRALR